TATLSEATTSGTGTSTLLVGEAAPANYTLTVTATSGLLTHSITLHVIVMPPVRLNCGASEDCDIESDSPVSNSNYDGHTIHFRVDGIAGDTGAANVTIPKSALPDISKLKVFVDHEQLSGADVTMSSDANNYYIYFKFTFHSPVQIDIQITTPENAPTLILGF